MGGKAVSKDMVTYRLMVGEDVMKETLWELNRRGGLKVMMNGRKIFQPKKKMTKGSNQG